MLRVELGVFRSQPLRKLFPITPRFENGPVVRRAQQLRVGAKGFVQIGETLELREHFHLLAVLDFPGLRVEVAVILGLRGWGLGTGGTEFGI
jgi:hypothetical protein